MRSKPVMMATVMIQTLACELAVVVTLNKPVPRLDDGNDVDDTCRNNCERPRCGDGAQQAGEECDDGNTPQTDACKRLQNAAGDGAQADAESCDDANLDDNDACCNDCSVARCGDGVVHVGREACDDGNESNEDGCRNDCALPFVAMSPNLVRNAMTVSER